MLVSDKALAVVGATSTEANRQILNGVLFESDGSTVATDGRILVKYTPNNIYPPEEFPAVEGISVSAEEPTLTPFVLHRDSITQIRKAIPSKSRLAVLKHAALDHAATNANGNAVLAVTDLETPQVFRPKKSEGVFPNYQAVMPSTDPAVVARFSVAVLEKLLKTLKAMDVKYINIGLRDSDSAANIAAETDGGEGSVTALVMPCSMPKEEN